MFDFFFRRRDRRLAHILGRIAMTLDDLKAKVAAQGAALDAVAAALSGAPLSPANQAKVDDIGASLIANDAKIAALTPPPA